ncbi:hypothetical protein ACFL27_05325 [candidate division CSSED10-310 bacterium]|uniref:Uncharacterized protein n=1 Tax=candidate division CSSED10-310 bacterium TaxID=2855610 RepID=A0ABV6YTS2_UNCC1
MIENQNEQKKSPTPISFSFAVAKLKLMGVGRSCDNLLVVSHRPTGTSRGGDEQFFNPCHQFGGTFYYSSVAGSLTIRGITKLKLFLMVDYG